MRSTTCALVTIALSVLIAFTPAYAADFTLKIFGNANMDDAIDELDIEYVQGIIDATLDPTGLADANYDGQIDEDDIAQIDSIINNEETELTLMDSSGNIVTVNMPIERMVLYHHQCAEVVQILGAQEKVVAVRDTFKDQVRRYPEISTTPSIGSGYDPDIEAILSQNSDLILAYSTYLFPDPEALEAKLPEDVVVLRMDCECNSGVEAVKESVVTMGYLLNKRENAKNYIQWHDEHMGEIAKRVAQIPEDERVQFFLESSGTDILSRTAIGQGHAAHQVCVLAGGDNIVVGNIPQSSEKYVEYGSVETEWILEQNPEIIVCRAMGTGIRPYELDDTSILESYSDEIRALPGFENVNAVINDRIYIITNDYAISPNYPTAVALMAKWFYPDLFEDLDPMAIHQEYMDLMGIPFDVYEVGAFFYPISNYGREPIR